MPALIDLRRRIKSVRNTQQITQAMKTVATAKFKKAQRSVLSCRPSWHAYPDLTGQIAFWVSRATHPLLAVRQEKKVHLLVISSDKGLCGAFNSNLLERARAFLEEKSTAADVCLVLAGKKARLYFAHHPAFIEWSCPKEIDKLTDDDYRDMARRLINHYVWSRTDAVYVAYNEFKSILAPRVTITRLLPIEKRGQAAFSPQKSSLSPIFEPPAAEMLEILLPFFVEDQVRHFFHESAAAEQAARMMAMENASKNAEDLISSLTLELNKIRQSMITRELLEIMTAVEALSKK